jgi:exosortase C (VPDSG-CTERM-specific)
MSKGRKANRPAVRFAESAKEQGGNTMEQTFAKQNPSPAGRSGRLKNFVLVTVILGLCFSVPLYGLVRFAVHSELYSYILLIPFITLYLVRLKKQDLPHDSKTGRKLAALFFTIGAVMMGVYWLIRHSGFKMAVEDGLTLSIFSFVSFFWGVCCLFWGRETLRAIAFPLGFLVFMVPLPVILQQWIETVLQYGSAVMAAVFFKLCGETFLREDLVFRLPGINLEVAPECSGIHSSLVLFITSLLAGYLFLRSPWNRTLLALVVIPLALIRNGFRVFVIGELCVHIGPEMIDSPIHRHGGPLFFILSLIPFFLLLMALKKSERRREESKPS